MRFFIVLFPYVISPETNIKREICKAEKGIILCKSDDIEKNRVSELSAKRFSIKNAALGDRKMRQS